VLVEYDKAPGVTRDRLYIDAMSQVYSNVSKVLVDSHSNSNLLYLPLDKLIQQAATLPAAAAPSSAAPSTEPLSSGADARSRDSQRSRERDIR
jgi:membrane protease subunit HflK